MVINNCTHAQTVLIHLKNQGKRYSQRSSITLEIFVCKRYTIAFLCTTELLSGGEYRNFRSFSLRVNQLPQFPGHIDILVAGMLIVHGNNLALFVKTVAHRVVFQ